MKFIPNSKGLYTCPCCNFNTLPIQPPNSFEICPVCFWEDDGLQYANKSMEEGANPVSLEQAQANYKKWGAIEESVKNFVREARAYERNK